MWYLASPETVRRSKEKYPGNLGIKDGGMNTDQRQTGDEEKAKLLCLLPPRRTVPWDNDSMWSV